MLLQSLLKNIKRNVGSLLVEQIYSPVQWTQCMRAMVDQGSVNFVECGPGKVLSGLVRRIDKSLNSYSLEDPEALAAAATTQLQVDAPRRWNRRGQVHLEVLVPRGLSVEVIAVNDGSTDDTASAVESFDDC